MPQEPKKRHSRQRQGKRRASISFDFSDVRHKFSSYNKIISAEKEVTKKPKAVEGEIVEE